MATSGSFDTSHRYSSPFDTWCTFSWWQTGQSVANNETYIDWNFKGYQGYSGSYTYVYNAGVTVDGSGRSGWSGNMANNTTLFSGSKTISHNNDGTKSFGADGWATIYAPNTTYSGSGSWSLNTIARASQPSINDWPNNKPDFNIGDTIMIHMNRASNSFTHTVKFNYGSTSYTVATGVTNNCTFDTSLIANDLYALIPDANEYSGTISVTTYNGSTNIGTKTCAYKAHVVNSDPIFTDFSYRDDTSATRSITGNNQYLIQNHSKLRVSISTSQKATAQNSATMVQYEYSMAGVAETAAYSSSTLYHTFIDYFDVSTDQTCTVTAVDSRGNSTSVQKTIHFVPYANPSIIATLERQSNFEANTTIHVAGAMSLIQVNGVTKNAVDSASGIQYRYKESTSSTWGSWTNIASTTASDGSITTTNFVISLDNQKEFDFEFKITDKLETVTISKHVGQGQPQFFVGSDGRVAVGGTPTMSMATGKSGQLEVLGNAYANGNRLAEVPIQTSDIADGAVTYAKIGWSSMKYGFITKGEVSSMSAGIRTDPYTVPENGVYFMSCGWSVIPNGYDYRVCDFYINTSRKNGTQIYHNQRYTATNSYIATLKKGDTVCGAMWANANNFRTLHGWLCIFRIA